VSYEVIFQVWLAPDEPSLRPIVAFSANTLVWIPAVGAQADVTVSCAMADRVKKEAISVWIFSFWYYLSYAVKKK
jgi:hypothetical protein